MGLTYAEMTSASAGDFFLHKKGRLPREAVKQGTVKALAGFGAYMPVIKEAVERHSGQYQTV